MTPIITSFLDTDVYKLTMLQAFCKYEFFTSAKYKLIFRDKVKFTSEMVKEIQEQILSLEDLRFTEDEIQWLRTIGWFELAFLKLLRSYQLHPLEDLEIKYSNEELSIIIDVPIIYGTMYEIYILAIISEVYFKHTVDHDVEDEAMKRLREKLNYAHKNISWFHFVEFGTRRRFSKHIQRRVVEECSPFLELFKGTSNLFLAKDLNLKPVGTMAHEWLQSHQVFTHIDNSEKMALERWLELYKGELGIALTDTLTTRHFLKVFDKHLANSFDGVRQDSGDPIEWCNLMCDHYDILGIDPTKKVFVFSDSLTFHKALEIQNTFKTLTCLFGIGTNLTNDVGVKPLNMVIKMIECNGFPTIKISDSLGKILCEDMFYKSFVVDYIERTTKHDTF